MQLKSFRFLFILCALLAFGSSVSALQVTRTPVPGVTFFQDINIDPAKPKILNVVTVDLLNPDLEVKPVIARDVVMTAAADKGREFVSSMVGRVNAVAGINADFFPFTGDPLGLCIVNGELISEPYPGRAAMGITSDRRPVFDVPRLDARLNLPRGASRQIDGINRIRETNQVILYTESYGISTQNKYKAVDVVCTSADLPVQVGKTLKLKVVEVLTESTDVPIPKGGVVISAGGPAAYFIQSNIKPDDELTVCFNLNSSSNIDWSRVSQAVGGGPWLVKDGAEFVDSEAQGFARAFETTPHPRTAVGATADGRLLMVTIDGRQPIAGGASLKDFAATLRRLGAVNAINLDGGGSTAMAVRGMLVNSPSEGLERLVANAIVVTSKTQIPELPGLKISGIENGRVAVGENTKLTLSWGDDQQILTDDQLAQVVWGVTGAVGFINQGGFFIPKNLRKGSISALYGTQLVSMPIEVVAGPPAKLEVKAAQDSFDPMRFIITATITDAMGNPCIGQEVRLSTSTGTLETETGATDSKGQFSAAVTWKPNAPSRAVTVTAGALRATVTCPATSPDPLASSIKLEATLLPDPISKLRYRVLATLTDDQGKPVAGKPIKITVTDGRPDAPTGLTNPRGEFTTGIVWKADAPAKKAVVSAGALTVTLESKE